MAQSKQTTSPTPEAAAGGSPAVRRDEQAEIAAENRQSAVEGSDDYLRRNSRGAEAAEAAVGKPAPGATDAAVGPDAVPDNVNDRADQRR